jgi:hypothetical protein
MKLKILNFLLLLIFLQLILCFVYAEDNSFIEYDIYKINNLTSNINNKVQDVSKEYFNSERFENTDYLVISNNLNTSEDVLAKHYTDSSVKYDFDNFQIDYINTICTKTSCKDSTIYELYSVDYGYNYIPQKSLPNYTIQEYLKVIDYSPNNDTLNIDSTKYNSSSINNYYKDKVDVSNFNYINKDNVKLDVVYVDTYGNQLNILNYHDSGNSVCVDRYSCIGNRPTYSMNLDNRSSINIEENYLGFYENYKSNSTFEDSALMIRHVLEDYKSLEEPNSNHELLYYIDGQLYK